MNKIVEIFNDELSEFLKKNIEKKLKFIWKNDRTEILGKYFTQSESNYNTELPEGNFKNLKEIGYDGFFYKIIGEIEEKWLEKLRVEEWEGEIVTMISIYDYPDEIRDSNDNVLWTSEEINEYHKKIIDDVHEVIKNNIKIGKRYVELLKKQKTDEIKKEIEMKKNIGTEYIKYLDDLKEYTLTMKNNKYINWNNKKK